MYVEKGLESPRPKSGVSLNSKRYRSLTSKPASQIVTTESNVQPQEYYTISHEKIHNKTMFIPKNS